MSNAKKIAYNTSLFSACRIASLIVQSIAYIIIARRLGKGGLGQFSVVFAYLSFFQIINGLGIDSIVIKELSINDRHPAIIGNAILIKLVGGITAIALSVLLLQLCGYDPEVKKYIYVASLSLLFGFSSTFAGYFQHHVKASYYSLPEMIVSMLSSLVMLGAVVKGSSVLVLVVINVFFVAILAPVYWIICEQKLNLKPALIWDPVLSKKILQSAWPILLSGLFIAVNSRVDQVMLFRLKGDAEVGLYAAVVKLTELLSFIPVVFSTVMFPFMCENFNRSREEFVFVYRRAFKYMAIIIMPVSFGTTILASQIVTIIYGIKFSGSFLILAVLIWSQIFVFMGCINANILVIMNLQKIMLFLTLFGAISNVLMNLWLIPLYSGLGAAIATVLSYSLVGILPAMVLRETRPIMSDYLRACIKPLVASSIMGVVVYRMSSLPLVAVIPAGIIIYVILMFLIKGVDEVDANYMRQILFKQRESNARE